MAKEYGTPIELNVTLKNPKRTIIMSVTHNIIRDDDNKEVGSISVDIAGRGVRVRVDKEDYDLDFKYLWNTLVPKLGKPEYIIP